MSDATPELAAFAPDVFREQDGEIVLLGGRCETCGAWSFPRVATCAEDGGPVAPRSIGAAGSLYSFTSIHVRPPFGLPAPYGLGAVELDAAPLRIIMLLDPARLDVLRIGARLRLRTAPMGVNLSGAPCIRPYFTPDIEGQP